MNDVHGGFLAGLLVGVTLAVPTVAGVKTYDKWLYRGMNPREPVSRMRTGLSMIF